MNKVSAREMLLWEGTEFQPEKAEIVMNACADLAKAAGQTIYVAIGHSLITMDPINYRINVNRFEGFVESP